MMEKSELFVVLEVFIDDFKNNENSQDDVVLMMKNTVKRFNVQFKTDYDPDKEVMDFLKEIL